MTSNEPAQPTSDATEPPDTSSDLKKFIAEVNIAAKLEKSKLVEIGNKVSEGYQADLQSRQGWENNLDTWTKLALQVKEDKTWPWVKASNVKYPLLSTAAMQFSARAYPALVPSDGQVVKAKVIGYDPDGKKADKAERVGRHMSYQVMECMPDWENDMDKLLIILPIVGTCFKKTYWDGMNKELCSTMVLPKDLVVNYWARSIETAERKTERLFLSPRVIKERQMGGVWLDEDLTTPTPAGDRKLDMDRTGAMVEAMVDETTPRLILEQHRFLDLDDDGYPEPYIVTIDESSRKVLRITARYTDEGVKTDASGKLIKIIPTEYYTKYGFIPNPDGGFYDLGFGLLLGTLNEAVNTLVNQLIDAGTLRNLQAGFISKGLRIKMGEARFDPGEWKAVNSTADDLRKQIVPLPSNEPSNVLFELLGTLITSAKELASVAEIFVGKMPGQNTPATTTMATIEQGMKVFTAIYKRIYRALDSEFKKIFELNKVYLDPGEEQHILDVPVTQSDYNDKSYDICPAADPQATSNTEKITKFQAIMQLMSLGTLNPQAVTLRGLQALEIPNPQELMAQGPPPPDPKTQALQQQTQIKMQEAQQAMQLKAQSAAQDAQSGQQQTQQDAQLKAQELQFQQAQGQAALVKSQQDLQANAIGHLQELHQTAQTHQLTLRQKEEAHKVALQQAKEKKPSDKR